MPDDPLYCVIGHLVVLAVSKPDHHVRLIECSIGHSGVRVGDCGHLRLKALDRFEVVEQGAADALGIDLSRFRLLGPKKHAYSLVVLGHADRGRKDQAKDRSAEA